jgi:uncharacterized protein YecT (DUF1311 family)
MSAMPRIAVASAAALIGAAVFAYAGERGEPGSCTGSTPEMVDCLNAQRAHWDKELTIAYQERLKDADPQQRELLRQAERAWIKFRDANCAYMGAGEGTISSINAAECLRGMTEKRARELGGGEDRN